MESSSQPLSLEDGGFVISFLSGMAFNSEAERVLIEYETTERAKIKQQVEQVKDFAQHQIVSSTSESYELLL